MFSCPTHIIRNIASRICYILWDSSRWPLHQSSDVHFLNIIIYNFDYTFFCCVWDSGFCFLFLVTEIYLRNNCDLASINSTPSPSSGCSGRPARSETTASMLAWSKSLKKKYLKTISISGSSAPSPHQITFFLKDTNFRDYLFH